MFIHKGDLHTTILADELEEIVRGDDTIVASAIHSAEAEMRTYLYDTFDVNAIFATTGDDRHQLLVNLCADIAVYLLVARLQAGQYIEDRRARYDRAIAWLKMSAKTELYNDLPRRETTVQTHISAGSNTKRSNYY
jgi:phage gp36-like protein